MTSWDELCWEKLVKACPHLLFCKTVLEILRSPVFSRGFQLPQTQPKLGSAETHLRVWPPSSMIWILRKDLCLVSRDGSSWIFFPASYPFHLPHALYNSHTNTWTLVGQPWVSAVCEQEEQTAPPLCSRAVCLSKALTLNKSHRGLAGGFEAHRGMFNEQALVNLCAPVGNDPAHPFLAVSKPQRSLCVSFWFFTAISSCLAALSFRCGSVTMWACSWTWFLTLSSYWK